MMPVNYPPGIMAEHRATRAAVGVFDVSHMGQIHFRGARAAEAVQYLVTNRVGSLRDGRALYTVACRPDGGIVDDFIVYRAAADHFLIVVNASNIDKDRRWFITHTGSWCEISDASDETALIAFQGPLAERALASLTTLSLPGLRSFDFVPEVRVAGHEASIARTGYTGEDGFEIFCRSRDAEPLWEALIVAAQGAGGGPVGLGARDTLRLEARLPLYGNDLTDTTTPIEAGLGWVVKPEAGPFIGREALVRQIAEGPRRRLAGFVMNDRAIARHGYPILAPAPAMAAEAPEAGSLPSDPAGAPIAGGAAAAAQPTRVGEVTSGTVGPSVGKNIGLGYVPAPLAEPGTRLLVDCRGKMAVAEVVKGPFYRRPPR
jgi:aminomethyltransferase